MKMILTDFINDWNAVHKKMTFTVNNSALGRVNNVEIRFSASAYQNLLSLENWGELNYRIEERSHGTMAVATNFHLFERGIIEIKVASSNYNYKEEYIISTLKWIGTELFPG